MKQQQLYSLVRQAVQDYGMIAEGDLVALGVSGGKDSLTLLYALAGLRGFYPKPFGLVAIIVDLGLENMDFAPVQTFCEELGVPCHIVNTEIARIVFEGQLEGSPCSLCARMRKGALGQKALELGCNKVAYAHHMDDMVETALLSLLYEGRFYCFPPVTQLNDCLTVIRPLMYVKENEVLGFLHRHPLPVVESTCPMDTGSRRAEVKQAIRQLQGLCPDIRQRIFHAILNAHLPDWPDKITETKNQ